MTPQEQTERVLRAAKIFKWCMGTICIVLAIYIFVLQPDAPPITVTFHGWGAVALVIIFCMMVGLL